ncbi:MAG: hypothetical protein LUI87_13070 [Lachnospiraceae bacterium]|nr:hypothetical protein [Lachnospiraceae bacterium]
MGVQDTDVQSRMSADRFLEKGGNSTHTDVQNRMSMSIDRFFKMTKAMHMRMVQWKTARITERISGC